MTTWTEFQTHQDVNLTTQDVFCFFESIRRWSCGASNNLVKAGGDVGRGVRGLGPDGVEVCCGAILARWERDKFVARAFDDGEWD